MRSGSSGHSKKQLGLKNPYKFRLKQYWTQNAINRVKSNKLKFSYTVLLKYVSHINWYIMYDN